MNGKSIKRLSALSCVVGCAMMVSSTVYIVGFTNVYADYQPEDDIQAYIDAYENALRQYKEYLSAIDSDVAIETTCADIVDDVVAADEHGDVSVGDHLVEPDTGNDELFEEFPATDGSMTISYVDMEIGADDDGQRQGNDSVTEPEEGDSVSSEQPVPDEFISDGTTGGSDETEEQPESGTLISLVDVCVRDSDGHWVYIVKANDTLSYISGLVGFSVQELADFNNIENVNLIYGDQVIRLPHD